MLCRSNPRLEEERGMVGSTFTQIRAVVFGMILKLIEVPV
jgi:hypothetical protein